MRLSVDDISPLTKRAIILLNRAPVKYCIEADEESGYVITYDKNWLRVRMEGEVKILDPLEINIHEIYTRCDRG